MLGDRSSVGTDFASCIQVLCRVLRSVPQDSRTIYADLEMIKMLFSHMIWKMHRKLTLQIYH